MQFPLDFSIRHVRATPFAVPLSEPMALSGATIGVQQHVLVEIHDFDGHVGMAEAIARPHIYGETLTSILGVFNDTICSLLPEQGPEAALAALSALPANNTARGAVELALHDLALKRLNLGSRSFLAPGREPFVETSGMLGMGEPAAVADQARELRDRHGFRAWKLKVGLDLENDVRTCAMVRDAIGPSALLYVDANHGYAPDIALQFWQRTRELGVAFLEEPCPPGIVGRQRLVRDGLAVVMGDEFSTDASTVARQIIEGSITMASIKTARTALRHSAAIRDVCKALGAGILIGSQGDSGIGTAASMAFAVQDASTLAVPGEFAFFLEFEHDLLAEPLEVVDGRIAVPDGPGIVPQLDPEQVERLALATAVLP